MKNWPWYSIRLVLLCFAMLFLFSFARKRTNSRTFNTVDITFVDEVQNSFITNENVNNLLKQNFGQVLTIEKEKVDLSKIEKVLDKHPNISKSEVYQTVDGALKVIISQKQPVARVIDNEQSYYIDSLGSAMPLSSNFSARVLTIQGKKEFLKNKDVLSLLNVINNDDFLKKNIIAVSVLDKTQIELWTREHRFKIFFGKPIDIQNKLNKYKAFYLYASKDSLIDTYKRIDLTFAKQIVCE